MLVLLTEKCTEIIGTNILQNKEYFFRIKRKKRKTVADKRLSHSIKYGTAWPNLKLSLLRNSLIKGFQMFLKSKNFKVFGNGSRMSDKNLVILEFKYLQDKKW